MNKDFELMELLLDSLLVEQQTKLQLIRFLIVKLIKIHKRIGAKTACHTKLVGIGADFLPCMQYLK